jgi:hypothetical protein
LRGEVAMLRCTFIPLHSALHSPHVFRATRTIVLPPKPATAPRPSPLPLLATVQAGASRQCFAAGC